MPLQINYFADSKQRHLLIDALNLARGGGVVVMARLAHAFAEAGYQVTVLVARKLPKADIEGNGISTIIERDAIGPIRTLLYRKFKLSALARNIEADAILSFNYFSDVPLPQVTYHINVIPFENFYLRCKAVGVPRALVQGYAARTALKRSTANFFESDYIRSMATYVNSEISNPMVAYIGADFPNQMPIDREPRSHSLYVTVTSGSRHKRNDLTLAFFRCILQDNPNARLEIIGEADAIQAGLSQEDREFVLSCSAVRFLGYIGRDKIYDCLSCAKALIVFSELESFFMVAIEAMSVGCPVIAADNSGVRETVGSVGLLVPAGDVDAAVSAARTLDDLEAFSRIEQAGRNWALNFEAKQCTRRFVEAFERSIWPQSSNRITEEPL